MALESATFISGLNTSNPVGATDPKSQGDDHLRLIKSTLLNTLPNITGAMNASHTELNNLVGVTGTTGTGDLVLSASPTLTGTLTAAAITASGIISGDGSGLTALDAANLTGEIADARLSANVPLLNAANTFTQDQVIQEVSPQLTFDDTDGPEYALAVSTDRLRIVRLDGGTFELASFEGDGAGGGSAITFAADISVTADVDITGALTATSYGGITEANLVDKSATETIAGAWTFSGALTMSGNAVVAGSGDTLGFYGSAGTTKPEVTGSREVSGGFIQAFNNLLIALDAQGIITDSSTL